MHNRTCNAINCISDTNFIDPNSTGIVVADHVQTICITVQLPVLKKQIYKNTCISRQEFQSLLSLLNLFIITNQLKLF